MSDIGIASPPDEVSAPTCPAVPRGVHIFGASGSGTSTFGEAWSKRFGTDWLDTDSYYRMPTEPKFREKRPIDERLTLMRADLDAAHGPWIVSGSLVGWGDPLVPSFDLIVFLKLDPTVRMTRLRAREYERLGEEMHPGGTRAAESADFLAWCERYDTAGLEQRSLALHRDWIDRLVLPVLELDSINPVDTLVDQALAYWQTQAAAAGDRKR